MEVRDHLRQIEQQAQLLVAPKWSESPSVVVPAVGISTGIYMLANLQGRPMIGFVVIMAFVAVMLIAHFQRPSATRVSMKQDIEPDSSLNWQYPVGFMAVFFILYVMIDLIPDPGIGISIVLAIGAAVLAMAWLWLVLKDTIPQPITLLTDSRGAPADAGLSPKDLEICAALIAAGATEGEIRREMRAPALNSLFDAPINLHPLIDRGHITVFHEYGAKENTDWITLTRAGETAARSQVAALGVV